MSASKYSEQPGQLEPGHHETERPLVSNFQPQRRDLTEEVDRRYQTDQRLPPPQWRRGSRSFFVAREPRIRRSGQKP